MQRASSTASFSSRMQPFHDAISLSLAVLAMLGLAVVSARADSFDDSRGHDLGLVPLDAPRPHDPAPAPVFGSLFEPSVIVAMSGALLLFHHWRLATARRRANELSRRARQSAERLETLHDLLTICASCKQIRDEDGVWTEVETYLQRRTELDFSHGCCPTCLHEQYPEIARRIARRTPSPTVHATH